MLDPVQTKSKQSQSYSRSTNTILRLANKKLQKKHKNPISLVRKSGFVQRRGRVQSLKNYESSRVTTLLLVLEGRIPQPEPLDIVFMRIGDKPKS